MNNDRNDPPHSLIERIRKGKRKKKIKRLVKKRWGQNGDRERNNEGIHTMVVRSQSLNLVIH